MQKQQWEGILICNPYTLYAITTYSGPFYLEKKALAWSVAAYQVLGIAIKAKVTT